MKEILNIQEQYDFQKLKQFIKTEVGFCMKGFPPMENVIEPKKNKVSF